MSAQVAGAVKALKGDKVLLGTGRPVRMRGVQQTGWSVGAIHWAIWSIAAVYFLITQVRWGRGGVGKPIWHALGWHTSFYAKLTWDFLPLHVSWLHWLPMAAWVITRHLVFRGEYEVVWAILLVWALVVPDKAPKPKPGWFTRALMFMRLSTPYQGRRTRAWQMVYAAVMIFVVTTVIGIAGVYLLYYGLPSLWHHFIDRAALHIHVPIPPAVATDLADFRWQALVIGTPASIVAKKIFTQPAKDLRQFFLDRRAWKAMHSTRAQVAGLTQQQARRMAEPKFPYPPTTRELYAQQGQANAAVMNHGVWESRMMIAVTAFMAALAPFGFWVLYVYAKAHGGH